MKAQQQFEVIIIGGSYSGLAAGMALGRSLRRVLIIDGGSPCNQPTPHSHNFLTQDGKTPHEIAALARQQVGRYETVSFLDGVVTNGSKTENGFAVQLETGETYGAGKLVFATGIRDILPELPGFSECWGKSVLHCPYCHGYEVRNERTGILANGEAGFELSAMVSNWTPDLTLYTNGKSTLTDEQTTLLRRHNIAIVEDEIETLEHSDGYLHTIVFRNGSVASLGVLYARVPFEQHCGVPQTLGCELTELGHLKVDAVQKTTVDGVFACGDNATPLRTVANAVSMGTMAGMMINKELIMKRFSIGQ
jgi:thioredoxin reductase